MAKVLCISLFILLFSASLAESCAEHGERGSSATGSISLASSDAPSSQGGEGLLVRVVGFLSKLLAVLGISKGGAPSAPAPNNTLPSYPGEGPSPSGACAFLQSHWVASIKEAYALGMEGEDSGQLDEAVEQALDAVMDTDCTTQSPIVLRCKDKWMVYQNARAGIGAVSKEARLIELVSCVESPVDRSPSTGFSLVPYGCWGKYRRLVDALALQSGADAAQQSFELCLVVVAADSHCLSEHNKYQAAFMNYQSIDANTQADILWAVKDQYATARSFYEACRKRNPLPSPAGSSCDSAYYTYMRAARNDRFAQGNPSADAGFKAQAKQDLEAAQGAFADCRLG